MKNKDNFVHRGIDGVENFIKWAAKAGISRELKYSLPKKDLQTLSSPYFVSFWIVITERRLPQRVLSRMETEN